MLAILGNRTFRALFTAQVVALVGTGLLTVALGLLAYDLAGSRAGAVLGTALAIKMAAYVFVAPVVGAVAYRIPRRALLIGSDLVRAAIALTLPFVDQTWQIYVLIFVLQAASATFTPTFQSVIPTVLVDERGYTRGLSLSRLAYDLESLLSPALAAALLTVLTYNDLFLGTVVGFLLSATLVATTRIPTATADRRCEPFLQRITLGGREMFGRPILRALLALNLAVAAATALVVVNTVVYVRDLLAAESDAQVAILLACYGAGSMSVALLVPRLLTGTTDRLVMLTGAIAVAVTLTATAAVLFVEPSAAVGWGALVVLWCALGAATSLINTPSARLLRYQSDEDNRSSVFTAQFSLSHACFFVTYPLAGWLGAYAGQAVAATVLALLAAGAAVVATRIWPASQASANASITGRSTGGSPVDSELVHLAPWEATRQPVRPMRETVMNIRSGANIAVERIGFDALLDLGVGDERTELYEPEQHQRPQHACRHAQRHPHRHRPVPVADALTEQEHHQRRDECGRQVDDDEPVHGWDPRSGAKW